MLLLSSLLLLPLLVVCRDGFPEDCPRPRGRPEDKKSWPWPCLSSWTFCTRTHPWLSYLILLLRIFVAADARVTIFRRTKSQQLDKLRHGPRRQQHPTSVSCRPVALHHEFDAGPGYRSERPTASPTTYRRGLAVRGRTATTWTLIGSRRSSSRRRAVGRTFLTWPDNASTSTIMFRCSRTCLERGLSGGFGCALAARLQNLSQRRPSHLIK